MKTIRIFTMAAAALILAACGNEEFIENVENGAAEQLVPMTFTANMPQTRTYLSGGTNVHWSKGDEIALWDNTDKRKFTATEIDGSSATFTGEANASNIYIAAYPYNAVVGEMSRIKLPAKQTAKWKSFDNNLAISYAVSMGGGLNLQFKNACALVKFYMGLSATDVKTVSLVARNGEVLAGTMSLNLERGELIPDVDSSSRIDLSGPFEPAIDYYFVVRPCTLAEGFSLLVEYNDGTLKRTEVRKPVTLKAGQILDIGAPKNLGPYISQAILPEGMGTPNGDGSVTLSELDLIALEEIEWLNLSSKGLKNLSGIEVYSNLKQLTCNDNPGLTKIDVRKLTKLVRLECNRNALTELKVNGLSNLQVLSCYQNQLTSLDLTGLTNLRTLSCSQNQLTSLDLTGLTSLKTLSCYENPLTSLNLAGLTSLKTLSCYENQLTSLSLAGLTSLKNLYCYKNQLTSLNLAGLTSLTTLHCYKNQLTELDISMLPALDELRCSYQSGTLSLFMTEEQYSTMWPSNKGYNYGIEVFTK